MKNIVYVDNKSRKIKSTAYATFDEAQYSQKDRSTGASRLYKVGTPQSQSKHDTNESHNDVNIQLTDTSNSPRKNILFVTPMHKEAYLPTKGSPGSAGLDLHALTNATILPRGTTLIDTGIAITLPKGTYGRIASRSGLALRNSIDTKAGVIDPDYTGSLKIILHNYGDKAYNVAKGDRIAQLIIEKYTDPIVQCNMHSNRETHRNDNGFGSTGIKSSVNVTTTSEVETDEDMVNMIWKSPQHSLSMDISTKTNHKTLGLKLKETPQGIQIIDCEKGTPAAKLPQWRTTLKIGHIRKIGADEVKTIHDVETIVKKNDMVPLPYVSLPNNLSRYTHKLEYHNYISTNWG